MKLQDVVASELDRAGLDHRPVEPLCRYLELLHHWGRRVNLTARPQPDVVARRLLPDALVLSRATSARTVVDVGSGSGIVGLVLAVVRPDVEVQLVEPSGKRCSFLRTAAHALQLARLTVVEARLEQLALEPRELAASRATWTPEKWLRRAADLVLPDGAVACFLSGSQPPPEDDATLALDRNTSYQLADGTERQLALYRRRCFT